MLVVVVAVGWKCTPRGHEPLHAVFGLGDFRHRRRRTRRRRGQQREGERWYGGRLTNQIDDKLKLILFFTFRL